MELNTINKAQQANNRIKKKLLKLNEEWMLHAFHQKKIKLPRYNLLKSSKPL